MNDIPGHVTVALSVFNGASFVAQAIESITRQSYGLLDLYIIDDASKDDTFEVALPFAKDDPRVHLVRLAQNIGTYAAKNLVLCKFCRGEFFAHQDADDFSRENRLARQVALLQANDEYAACGTAIDEIFESRQHSPRIPSESPIRFDEEDQCFHRENHYPTELSPGNYYSNPLEDLARIKIAMNGSLMFRSAILRKLGGYDGTTPVAGDTELLWRLLAQYRLANLPEVLYSRRFHTASLTRSKNLGFESKTRRDYIVKIQQHMMAAARLNPNKLVTQDFYFPNVEFEEFS